MAFDPDAYLKDKAAFDPDAYLANKAQAAPPVPVSPVPAGAGTAPKPPFDLEAANRANESPLATLGENVFHGASSLAGSSVGGLVGGLQAILTQNGAGGAATAASIQDALTYEPRTEGGKRMLALIQKIPQLTNYLGQKLTEEPQEITRMAGKSGLPPDNPRLRAAYETTVETAADQIPSLIGAKLAGPGVARAAKAELPALSRPSIIDALTGSKAKAAAGDLQGNAAGLAGEKAGQARAAAEAPQATKSAADRALNQLQNQPAVAAQRVQGRAGTDSLVDVKAAVREKAAARARAAEESARKSGATAEEAKASADEAGARSADASAAADLMEKGLLERPGMKKEEFGSMLRTATEAMERKYTGIRSEQAGFGKALSEAPDSPTVSTKAARDLIDDKLKDIRNPELQSVMSRVKSLMQTGVDEQGAPLASKLVTPEGRPLTNVDTQRLNLRAADSLRKYLDDITSRKMVDDKAVSKETLGAIRDVRQSLVDSASAAHPSYAEAMSKFAEHSRPLDIISKNGGLKSVLETDSLSANHKLSEAEVTGAIIAKANRGHPVLERLLSESPEIKDPARLYFTQELFGQDVAPTAAKFDAFLKSNERSLRQLGLYDEFKDIASARKSAQKAVDDARGVEKEAKAQSAQASKEATRASREAAQATSLSKTSAKRLEEAAKGPGPEKEVADLSRRAASRERELERKSKSAQSEVERHTRVADRFSTFQTEIARAKPSEVAGKIKSLGKSLVDEGLISQDEYGKMIDQANAVDKEFSDTAKVRSRVAKVAGIVGLGAAGQKLMSLIP